MGWQQAGCLGAPHLEWGGSCCPSQIPLPAAVRSGYESSVLPGSLNCPGPKVQQLIPPSLQSVPDPRYQARPMLWCKSQCKAPIGSGGAGGRMWLSCPAPENTPPGNHVHRSCHFRLCFQEPNLRHRPRLQPQGPLAPGECVHGEGMRLFQA